MSFRNLPAQRHVCSIRIGDESHTARKATRITTTKKANALSLGDIVRGYFYDYLDSEFCGLYRVVEIQPSEHEGNYRTFVLQRLNKGSAQ